MRALTITLLALTYAAAPSFAAGPATKAKVSVERRAGDDIASVTTWQLRGGTKISTEIVRRSGKKVGYSRTVERTNQSKHTIGKMDGVAFAASSGYVGGVHLSTRHGADGNGYASAINPNGITYARFNNPLFDDKVMKIRAKR